MQQKESLSAYMDGEKVEANFAETLTKSPELEQKWASYHAIRSVMQGEEMLLGRDFSAKMEALIEKENIESKPRGILLHLKRWSTPLMQAGIAAAVCLVAVVGVNRMNAENEIAKSEPALQTLPFSDSVQPVSYNAPTKNLLTVEKLEQQQRRIDELLQNHELQRRTNATNANDVIFSEEEKATKSLIQENK